MAVGRRGRSGKGRGVFLGSHHTQMILLNPFPPMQNLLLRLILGLSALTFPPEGGERERVECEGFLNPTHLFINLISPPTLPPLAKSG